MRILFITDNFPPEVNAPATRTYEHCREWVKQGADVTVITCFPNFPQGKVYEGYKNKFFQKEVVDGIKVIRTWSYITSNAGFVKRTLDYISFAFMSFWFSLFIKTDIIIGTSPQFFVALSAYCSSIFKRKKRKSNRFRNRLSNHLNATRCCKKRYCRQSASGWQNNWRQNWHH